MDELYIKPFRRKRLFVKGEELAKARRAAGLTQEEFANRCSLSKSTIGRRERKKETATTWPEINLFNRALKEEL